VEQPHVEEIDAAQRVAELPPDDEEQRRARQETTGRVPDEPNRTRAVEPV